MKPKKIIGILGGAGPLATAKFFSDVVSIAQTKYSAEQDTDFPVVYLYNMPMEGFDETGFSNPDLVKEQLISGVKEIEKWGADFIVLPCNTVHYFFNEMQKEISIPIISIIDSTISAVKKYNYKKIGILSSASTRTLELYKLPFEKNGLSVLIPSDEEQKEIDSVILSVMAGKNGLEELNILKIIIEKMIKSGVQGIVLGCTEIPLAISQSDIKIPLFNGTNILAENAVDETYKK